MERPELKDYELEEHNDIHGSKFNFKGYSIQQELYIDELIKNLQKENKKLKIENTELLEELVRKEEIIRSLEKQNSKFESIKTASVAETEKYFNRAKIYKNILLELLKEED